jgi:hypothetical protein
MIALLHSKNFSQGRVFSQGSSNRAEISARAELGFIVKGFNDKSQLGPGSRTEIARGKIRMHLSGRCSVLAIDVVISLTLSLLEC